MSDDPMVIRLEERCKQINGELWSEDLGLSQLMNPSTVVNLERELAVLREELEGVTDAEAKQKILDAIEKKEDKQVREMRGVMQDWLKAVFVWQSVLSIIVCGFVSYGTLAFPFPETASSSGLDLAVQVLGFWGIWLFTIPSLRSRKPGGVWGMSNSEKAALDISFLLTPLVNLVLPAVTKDPPAIFWANLAVLAGCYGWFFFVSPPSSSTAPGSADASLPEPIKFALKALDFGSGRERGAPAEIRERMQAELRMTGGATEQEETNDQMQEDEIEVK